MKYTFEDQTKETTQQFWADSLRHMIAKEPQVNILLKVKLD